MAYRRPGKQEAFEDAERLAGALEMLDGHAYRLLQRLVAALHPALSSRDVEDVAAKAMRRERGRRRVA